jgi:ribosome-binding factor A
VAKVAKQIEREVGQLLISDKALQAAVCPERRRGYDGALSALASVTEVQVSNDLQVAKVYLSIYSDEVGKAAAMQGLQRLEGYVRKHVGKQVGKHVGKHVAGQRADGAAQPLP